MDPLSLTASLLTIVATAQLAFKSLRTVNVCRRALQDLDSLSSELRSIKECLTLITAFLNNNEGTLYIEILTDPLERAFVRLNDLNAIIPDSGLVTSGRGTATLTKVKWARRRSDFLTLREELKMIRIDLVLGLSLVTA